jgi:predicted XRE-type DNA-binding protein
VTDLAQTNVMALRAELMNHVRQIVQTEGWTQSQAAEHLGVAQSRVSDLLNGKFEKFSLDMLITLASRVGCRVELAVL